jgi:hypothetical protein
MNRTVRRRAVFFEDDPPSPDFGATRNGDENNGKSDFERGRIFVIITPVNCQFLVMNRVI